MYYQSTQSKTPDSLAANVTTPSDTAPKTTKPAGPDGAGDELVPAIEPPRESNLQNPGNHSPHHHGIHRHQASQDHVAGGRETAAAYAISIFSFSSS